MLELANGAPGTPGRGKLAGHFRFGAGQMRVFARTARPIGKMAALAPLVVRDYTKAGGTQY